MIKRMRKNKELKREIKQWIELEQRQRKDKMELLQRLSRC